MSFGRVLDMPRFENYNEALAYFTKTKGIRGRLHLKPLKSSRRDPDHYRIDINKDGGIECWLYQTPVLTYYPDKLVVNTFDSRTTCAFVDDIAPRWLWSFIQGGTQIIGVCHQMGSGAAGYFIGNRIEVGVDKDYRPVKGGVRSAQLEKVVLNRTRAAQARKQCAEVLELARVTSKVDGYWAALKDSDEVIEEQAMQWLKNILKIGGYYQHERWNGSVVHAGFNSWGEPSAELLLPRMKKHLYKAMYKNDGCYDYERAPYGVIPKEWRIM